MKYALCYFVVQLLQIMLCTLFKLLWQSPLSEIKCGGTCQKIANLSGSAVDVLKNQKCRSNNDHTQTFANVLINRITPHNIEPTVLGALEVCKSHEVGI